MIRTLLTLSTVVLLSACGPQEAEQPKHSAPAKAPVRAKVDNSTLAKTHWEWPATKGAARDLNADDTACRTKTADKGNPMAQLGHYTKCMLDLGWQYKG